MDEPPPLDEPPDELRVMLLLDEPDDELRVMLLLDEPEDELRVMLLLDEPDDEDFLEPDSDDRDDDVLDGEKRLLAVPELLRTELLPDFEPVVDRVLLTRLDDVEPLPLTRLVDVKPLLLTRLVDVEPLLPTRLLDADDDAADVVERVLLLPLMRLLDDDDVVPADVDRTDDDVPLTDDDVVLPDDVFDCSDELLLFMAREVPETDVEDVPFAEVMAVFR